MCGRGRSASLGGELGRRAPGGAAKGPRALGSCEVTMRFACYRFTKKCVCTVGRGARSARAALGRRVCGGVPGRRPARLTDRDLSAPPPPPCG